MCNKHSKGHQFFCMHSVLLRTFYNCMLYKTLPDIVLMVDRKEGAILDFIAIVSWVYCYVLKPMHLCIGCVYRHL